jgi:hypothetical protein
VQVINNNNEFVIHARHHLRFKDASLLKTICQGDGLAEAD